VDGSVSLLPLYAFMMGTGTTLVLKIHYCAFRDKIKLALWFIAHTFNIKFNVDPLAFSEMRQAGFLRFVSSILSTK